MSEDQKYKTLEDKSLVILNNLDKITDEGIIKEIVTQIDQSSVAHHYHIYKTVEAFYDRNKRFPDINYLRSQFGEAVRIIDEPNFSSDFITGFMNDIVEEKLSTNIRLLAIEHKFTGIADLVGDYNTRNKGLIEYTSDDALKEYELRRQNPAGIMLGVPEIDEYTHGISYGNPCVIGGGPGSGKTTFAISATYEALMKRFNCVYITTELSQTDLMFNFWSRHSLELGYNLPADKIKKATLNKEEHENLLKVKEDWDTTKRGKLRIYQGSDFIPYNPSRFRIEMEELYKKWGELDVVVLDYIQNCIVWKEAPQKDPTQFLNEVVEHMRSFSVDFKDGRGVVLLLLSQLNREGIKKIMRTHNADLTCFADLNTLERSAHTAIVIHGDASSKLAGQVMMQIIKNRSGETMAEMRTVNFEPKFFKVGGGSVGTVLNESSLDDMADMGPADFNSML